MSSGVEPRLEPDHGLQERVNGLESENQQILRQTEQRVILAELKVEAIRAGIVDLDGLTFLDLSRTHLDEHGVLAEGASLIMQLKRAKPWLFVASSSSTAHVPLSKPGGQKLATEMTAEEYRIARANIIRRS